MAAEREINLDVNGRCCISDSDSEQQAVPPIPRTKELQTILKPLIHTIYKLKRTLERISHCDVTENECPKIFQIYGLSLTGKAHLVKSVIEEVKHECSRSSLSCEVVPYSANDLNNFFEWKDKFLTDLTSVTSKFGAVIAMFGRAESIAADTLEMVLNNILSFKNTCCIFTSSQKYDFVRLGPKIKSFRLQCLTEEERRQYFGTIGIQVWLQIICDILRETCGFPFLIHFAAEKIIQGKIAHKEVLQVIKMRKVTLKEDIMKKYPEIGNGKIGGAMHYIPGPFNTQAISLISGVTSKFGAKRYLADFNDAGILSCYETKNDKYFINCLLRSIWEERFKSNANYESIFQNRFCAYYAKILKDMGNFAFNNSHYNIFDEEFPNLNKLIERAVYCIKEEYDVLIEVAHKAEYLIIVFLHGKEVVTFYEACLEAAKERRKMKDIVRMKAAFGHALLIIDADVKVALEYLQDAYEEMKKGGYKNYELAMVTSSIGQSLHLQGKHNKSIRYFEEALSYLDQDILASLETPFRLTIRVRITFFYCQALVCIGNYSKGAKKMDQVLSMLTTLYGSYHPHLGPFLTYKGLICKLQGQVKDAFKYHTEGLYLRLKAKKKPSVPISRSLSHVAHSYLLYHNDPERALFYIQDAYDNLDADDPNHPDRSFIDHTRGEILQWQEKYEEAKDMFEKAAWLRWVSYGFGANCCCAESFVALADMNCMMGEMWEAGLNYIRALYIEIEFYRRNNSRNEMRMQGIYRKLSQLHEHLPLETNFLENCLTSLTSICKSFQCESEGLERSKFLQAKSEIVMKVNSTITLMKQNLGVKEDRILSYKTNPVTTSKVKS